MLLERVHKRAVARKGHVAVDAHPAAQFGSTLNVLVEPGFPDRLTFVAGELLLSPSKHVPALGFTVPVGKYDERIVCAAVDMRNPDFVGCILVRFTVYFGGVSGGAHLPN